MMNTPASASVELLLVVSSGSSADDLDTEVRRLRRELRESNFDTAELREAPVAGTKSAEALTLGALTVTLLSKLLPELTRILNGWLRSRPSRRLKLKLPNGAEFELSGSMTASQMKTVIDKLMTASAPDAQLGNHVKRSGMSA